MSSIPCRAAIQVERQMDWTSHRMEQIPPSDTLKMLEIARRLESKGKKLYHFEVGQPDFPTPPNIVDAAKKALDDGHTGYTSSRGIPPLLDAIQELYARRNLVIDGKSNVIVTPGAKMALFGAFLSTIDAGDDVLLLSPAWPTYRVMIRAAGGKPRDVYAGPDYQIDEEKLKSFCAKTVSCFVINSPNNPTGGILSKDHHKIIFDLAEDYDFVIFSDEIYETLVYDGENQTSLLEVDPAMERSLIISGFSKSYSMTGWRLGYAIGNEEAIDNLVRIQQNTTSCATSFAQYAGVEAIMGDQSYINSMLEEYSRRRHRMKQKFCQMEDVVCSTPKGAFYIFPDFGAYGLSSTSLAELILKKTGVVATPGSAFGDESDSYLRFSYATSIEVIEEGLDKLAEFLPIIK